MNALLRGNVGRSNLSRYLRGRSCNVIWRLSDSTTLNTAFVYHLKHYHKFRTSLCGLKRAPSLGKSTGRRHSLFLCSLYPLLKQVKEKGGFYRLFSTSRQRISKEDPSNENNQNDSNSGSEEGKPDPNQSRIGLALAYIAMSALIIRLLMTPNIPEITWNEFYKEMLSKGEVKWLEVRLRESGDKVRVYLHRGAQVRGVKVATSGPHFEFGIPSVDSFEQKMNQAQKGLKIEPSDFISIHYKNMEQLNVFDIMLESAVIIGLPLIWYFSRRSPRAGSKGGIFGNPFSSHTKAKATVVMPGTGNGVTFKDVAGMNEAKQEVVEFVDYLKSSERYSQLGAKIPKGALLVGPPGTGKTLLAKAVATEADVPFLSMAGSDFVEMFVGVGSARVRDLFARAKKLSPCIVYIDEVDAIGRSRQSSQSMGDNSESESTLNQLLVEMDGMNTVEGIVMLASTNRADILDQALLRPGRFDRLIAIDLPTLPERQAIFEVHLKGLTLGKPIKDYSKRLAELTPGHSGADIANICNEAALHAARLSEKTVDVRNFEYAVERVIAGMEKRSNTMSPEERRTQAFHEAGHAVVGWMLEHTDPLLKISIVPRVNSARGFSLYLPSDQKLYTTEQLFDRMCLALGGRAAEAKVFRKVTTGAEDDLKEATDMAYKQVVTFGMNDRVGNISFPVKKSSELSKKPYSDKLAATIDEEVRLLVGRAYLRTQHILDKNHDKLLKLTEELLDKEVLNYDDIEEVIGKCPYGDKRHKMDLKASGDASSTEQQLPNL